jgi:type II secretory pathway pseudopilin PulG
MHMRHTITPSRRARAEDAKGFSLLEMMISMGLLTLVIGTTLGGMANITRSNEVVLATTSLNGALRTSMDLMVRDMLQVGAGLPSAHAVTIPNGAGSTAVRLPGPPGSNFTTAVGATSIPAIIPRPGAGPAVNGVATDVVTLLMADNNFLNMNISAATASTIDVAPGPDIANGPDRVTEGQLIMVKKGSMTTLLQVTAVDTANRRVTFADGDSLNLNQSAAAGGNLAALNAAAPANTPAAVTVTRVRMITYYLDITADPLRPRLVRRINNGHHLTFNNNLGTAVAFDIENLLFSWDITNGTNNPGNVRMVALDLTAGGACNPTACSATAIRKANIALTGRNQNVQSRESRPLRNTLQSQVALRGMAFVDRYRSS